MRVFVAGATGALGVPLVRTLVGRGHEVTGLTRSPAKAALLEGLGARPAVGDVFDPEGLAALVREARPDGVVQILNALPKRGPLRPADLDATNRLRIEGTRNLIAAAVASGARRYVAESMMFGYGYGIHGAERVDEETPFVRGVPFAPVQPAINALNSLEDQVRDATERGAVEGVLLRFALFYGPGVGSTEFMVRLLRRRAFILPGGGRATGSWIHVEDGASAVAEALERAPAGAVYNVADDEPASIGDIAHCISRTLGLPRPWSVPMWVARLGGSYMALMARSSLAVSNERLRRDLGWSPRYPTYREGIGAMAEALGSRP